MRAARDEVGVDIRVIRGDEEARLIYLGARGSLDLGKRRVALFDLGGGSLEVVLADAQELYFTASLKLGVIRLAEACPISGRRATPRRRMAERACSLLKPVIARVRAMGFDFVAFTSGTASALAALLGLERERPNSQRTTPLPLKALIELERKLGGMRALERARMPGLDARRGDTIYTGAVVLRTVLELSGASEAALCETALREGIVADYVATNRPGILLVEEFPDLRRRSVMELARRCQFREPHATHVARLRAVDLPPDAAAAACQAGDAELLEYAPRLLHDIGFHVAPPRHHRHTEYLIQSHDMSGFSRDEVNVISLVARYHRKAEPSKSHDAFTALSKADRNRVRQLAAILRIADGLDRTDARLVRAVRCVVTDKIIEMRLDADGDPELELWAARRKGDMLEDLAGRKLRLTVDAVHEREEAGDAHGRLQVVR